MERALGVRVRHHRSTPCPSAARSASQRSSLMLVIAFSRTGRAVQRKFALSDDDIAYWSVHAIADEDHSGAGRELLDKFARTDADRRLVLKTVHQYLEMEKMMHQDIYRRLQDV